MLYTILFLQFTMESDSARLRFPNGELTAACVGSIGSEATAGKKVPGGFVSLPASIRILSLTSHSKPNHILEFDSKLCAYIPTGFLDTIPAWLGK